MVGQNFERKYYNEIFMKELTNALAENLISKQGDFESYIKNRSDISNFYVMILSIVAETVDDLYEDLDNEHFSNKIEYAVGSDLDDLGILLNCSRPNGTKSAVNLTFTLSERQDDEVTIPAGSILCTARNGLTFRSNEDLYFNPDETERTITFLCTKKGSKHQVEKNMVNQIDTDLSEYLTGTVTVINNESSFGGSDTFNDDDYRTLLKNWILKNQKGNSIAYTENLDKIDGLESYNLIPLWDGAGTVKIVLDCDESAAVMNRVWNEVNEVTKNIDADIFITTPDKVVINVFCTVDVNIDRVNPFSKSEMSDIEQKINVAINKYIKGGVRRNGNYYKGLTIGQDFIPFRAGIFITEEVPEVQNVVFSYPEEVINIENDEIGVTGEISITMR